ncbi:MAG: hypothetical protein U0232_11420 [Thermomicrobiales bacterium]
MVDDAVGIEQALGLVAVARAVAQAHSPTEPRRRAEGRDERAHRRHVRFAEVERDRALQGDEVFAQVGRQDALDFRQCGLDRGGIGGEADPPRGEQAERQPQRLVLGEHQRRQLEVGSQAVAAVPPLLGVDRDAQVLQHGDVATHGAAVDFEARGEFRAAEATVNLQEFERGQDARRRMVHASPLPNTRAKLGPIMSDFGARLEL